MKRIVIIITAVALLVPAVALAHRAATGSTRTAILRATRLLLPGEPRRCPLIEVTTKDGGNWATAQSGSEVGSCKRWIANDGELVHRVRGRWHAIGVGDGPAPCGKLGIPVVVRRDLDLNCGKPIFS
jgi:hypothetical protein